VLHCEIASSSTRCSCCKPVVLVTLGGCHILEGLVACDSVKACKEIVRCSGEESVRGTVLTPWRSRRATLVDCLWLGGSHLESGCMTPAEGLALDCQLARDPSSG